MVFSFDLTKAYNLLDRDLLRDLNARFGFPRDLSDLYFQFLGGLKQYFKVHQTVGDPCHSSTGVPEGCVPDADVEPVGYVQHP